jgi:hypothetical protein
MSPSPITNTYEFHISPTTLPRVEAGSNASLLVRMTQELLSGISRNIGESYSDQKITEKVAQKITDYLLSNQCGTLISDMDMCALSPFGPS